MVFVCVDRTRIKRRQRSFNRSQFRIASLWLRRKCAADELWRHGGSNYWSRPSRASLQPDRPDGKVRSFGRHVRGYHTHRFQAIYQRRRIRYNDVQYYYIMQYSVK